MCLCNCCGGNSSGHCYKDMKGRKRVQSGGGGGGGGEGGETDTWRESGGRALSSVLSQPAHLFSAAFVCSS